MFFINISFNLNKSLAKYIFYQILKKFKMFIEAKPFLLFAQKDYSFNLNFKDWPIISSPLKTNRKDFWNKRFVPINSQHGAQTLFFWNNYCQIPLNATVIRLDVTAHLFGQKTSVKAWICWRGKPKPYSRDCSSIVLL